MVGMNATAGPANHAGARPQSELHPDKSRLNTYIYDYLLKNEQFDLARSFIKTFDILKQDPSKPSPGRANGMDESMEDSKEDVKKPLDLPEPLVPRLAGDGSSFLLDWWCQFWDIYGARTQAKHNNAMTAEYLQHNMTQRTNRQQMQQRMVNGDQNMLGISRYNNMMAMHASGNINMAKRAMQQNANPQQQAQMMQQGKMVGQTAMQREGSQMEMNGAGRQSPSANNAPSPSKRPRLDDGNFNGQPMGPAGRGQPMGGPQMNGGNAIAGAAAPGGMLVQNGMTPEMQQQQMMSFQGNPALQQKQLEAMSQVGGVPQPGQMNPEDFATLNAQRMAAAGVAGQAGGNHALQDYQMQLMLLEQQNKKRLLMARQEQENTNHGEQGGPNDPQNRGSPAPGVGFDANGMPTQPMNPQYYAQLQAQQAAAQANGMGRPPSSHPGGFNMAALQNMNPQQLEMFRRQQQQQQQGMMPNGWQGGPQQPGQPMMPQPPQAGPGGPPGQLGQPPQQPQMGTPQQPRNNMPPPPAPTASAEQQRTQPSSPAPSAQAPPTPSQAPKANPKGGKKDAAAKPAKKNAGKKAGATGATPAAENAEPPTPTPSTPITPMHPRSFNQPNGAGPAAQAGSAPPPTAPQASATIPDPVMGMDADPNNGFAMFPDASVDNAFDLGFNLDQGSTDVLDSFDFDALLNNQEFNFNEPGELSVDGV